MTSNRIPENDEKTGVAGSVPPCRPTGSAAEPAHRPEHSARRGSRHWRHGVVSIAFAVVLLAGGREVRVEPASPARGGISGEPSPTSAMWGIMGAGGTEDASSDSASQNRLNSTAEGYIESFKQEYNTAPGTTVKIESGVGTQAIIGDTIYGGNLNPYMSPQQNGENSESAINQDGINRAH
jgi:hypothetical protein